jgi:broad specificity phosphatase PhoE
VLVVWQDIDGVWEQMSPRVYRNLDEIFAGEYEGMTYEDIKRLHSDEATLRSMDKIGYRYPRGESYFDILSRLDPLVHEMESYNEPLLIVSHQAVLRVLYAYLMGHPRTKAPKIEIPLHTVMKIVYDGWNPPREERFVLGPDPVMLSDDRPADDKDGQKHL